ncbi:ABC transporter ATP-binding protein [Rhodococcus sp. B10]|uniref:dipeptide ABC transporter ATP-binding protein n=1 Tax=Rhodococcus sp. B10 TaxID=2695876 RepID=UPI0014319F11|nr:ABC transporter ATP-binding protein [Rhodococcus sp. B10]NIL77324.1 Glutathione import ATP-binding protein GsiA [Rhodococcus sp. B10]
MSPDEDPLLAIDNLTVAYGKGTRSHRALQDVSFVVHPGETVAVVGESGSGKSTLAHAVLGLLPKGSEVTNGTVALRGRVTSGRPRKELDAIRGRDISLVPQDPTVSLNPVQRVGVQVAEALRLHGHSKDSAQTRSRALLDEVGLPDPDLVARSYPHELSGGMRQRVLIAIAMACAPALVIADEPTSALDVTVQKRVLDALGLMADKSKTSVLLITHDLGVAVERASRVLVFQHGRLVEHGDSDAVLRTPTHPYTVQLVAAAPTLGLTGRIRPRVVDTPVVSASEPGALVTAAGLRKTFRAGGRGPSTVALDDVSFSITKGTTHTLVGESGSGKTTVARLVARLEVPDSGTVSVAGHSVGATPAGGSRAEIRRWHQGVQLVYQNPYSSLDPRSSIESIVREPLDSFGIGNRAGRGARVRELLDAVALPERVVRSKPRELSGGQRQRVAIARALALQPELLILDEPVSALDVSVQDRVLRLLVDLQAEHHLTYLFITHDLAVVQQVSDTVSVMKKGIVVEEGTTHDVLTEPQKPYTRQLIDAVPKVGTSGLAEPATSG